MSDPILDGCTAVLTGATSGIGAVAARALAEMRARLVIVARDRGRGEDLQRRVIDGTGNDRIELELCDLASQREVRGLADRLVDAHDKIHLLVNNAGLISSSRRLTEDGVEQTLAVNHLAPFLLTNLLLDRLRASAPARVVTVASDAHRSGAIEFDNLSGERRFVAWQAYCNSKLANILFNSELARRIDSDGITANCLHPGVVATGLGRSAPLHIRVFFTLAKPFLLSPERGADTLVYLASSPEVASASGGYYERRRPVEPSAAARDRRVAARLWQVSEGLTGLDRGI